MAIFKPRCRRLVRQFETKTARRSRDWLVIGEVALTLLLLSAAGLVLKSFAKMQSVALGFEPHRLLTVQIDLPYTKYNEPQKIINFDNALLDEVRRLPGVQRAAVGANPPMLSGWQLNFLPEGAPPTDPSQQPSADSDMVTGDFFTAQGATLIRGRTFNATDTKESPRVVIVDQTLAERSFRNKTHWVNGSCSIRRMMLRTARNCTRSSGSSAT